MTVFCPKLAKMAKKFQVILSREFFLLRVFKEFWYLLLMIFSYFLTVWNQTYNNTIHIYLHSIRITKLGTSKQGIMHRPYNLRPEHIRFIVCTRSQWEYAYCSMHMHLPIIHGKLVRKTYHLITQVGRYIICKLRLVYSLFRSFFPPFLFRHYTTTRVYPSTIL